MPWATIRLRRRWSLFVGAPYEVLVDGARMGTVRNCEAIEFMVPPGRHALQMRAGRFFSASRSFDVGDGADIAFWCGGVRLWPVYVIALFRPQLGIKLRCG